eukprot:gene2188-2490_t
MNVSTSKNDGKLMVEACLGHVGNTMRLGHLRIPEEIRQTIAGNFSKGVTIESILDQIPESTESKISRGHLVDRKGIINVKHQLNVDLMEKDLKDTNNVHYWVQELEKGEFNPVLVDKNWRKGMKTHISTKDDMADIYAALKTMQFEENESKF